MERNCRRNLKREGINGIGCMWVFISLFGSNQKRLLMDLKRGSKRVSGNEMKQLTCSCESSSHESSVDKLIDDEEDIDVSIAGDEHVETTEVCKSLGDESEEKFKEIIKRLIAQKEGEIQTCKDLLEAFHVLGSEEESFMKKISHEDAQTLGEDSKRVVEVKPEVVSKEEAVVKPKRKPSFFSRKWKSEERRNRSQVAKTIVVLKPGPSSLNLDSSSEPHSNGNKSKTGRSFSRFLIGLVKRRLQSAVGKKSCDDHVDRDQNCCMQEEIQSKPDKHISDEEKQLCKERKSEVADEEDTVHTSEDSEKIMSGLYIAAKKHLAEMLANGDIDVNLPDKEVPRILGKILSLPEFCSPADSPKLIPEHDLVSNLSPLSQTIDKPDTLECIPDTNDLTDEDLDKEDDALFTIDVSVPNDSGKETEYIDKEEKPEIDPLSETCSSSISQQVENVDEDALEFREEHVKKEMFNQEHLPSSPPASPPSSSVRLTECKETATDVQGKLSPVSVLEPLFTDDDSSPTTSTSFSSAGMRMQPLCIRFDEADFPKPEKDNTFKISMDDKELTLAYIEAVVKSAGLSWDELLTRPFYSEQILEPELTDDVVFCPTQLCDDKNLLYDCIDEVLMDFCWNEFNPGPWISFLKPEVHLISDMEIAAKVAQEGVYWHLLPLPSPHTLDQIVKKDMARPGSWMDLRFEIGCLGSYTSEMILDELVEEIIMSCRDMAQVEPMQEPNSDNL
ncbi:PREDICTED: uncharacterized protein LOC104699768 [Camelina sativa]|uniref:Uncharacterized protein LOC104699768 n=1 Tax=Camelina sativa TaxID=90675 RepID=A0ABM0SMI9_CAMSA|nr:PREDICTED: uncharacterized protein LOC104699768 [Camelina sativa]XP_010413421.1 PREDICTED: uncharacterized protein LOC104699768 [Camelina sativa]XP_010413422.1 PREDICTED: uncharacterized protein LOC104699768 [Camelina sativa]XP_010413424.1 PREDICTED: uncharacterized protein LOC104699768 [Camelina sativa]